MSMYHMPGVTPSASGTTHELSLPDLKRVFFDTFGQWLTLIHDTRIINPDLATDNTFTLHLELCSDEVMSCREKAHKNEDSNGDYYDILRRLISLTNYATHNKWGRIAEEASALVKQIANLIKEPVGAGSKPALNTEGEKNVIS